MTIHKGHNLSGLSIQSSGRKIGLYGGSFNPVHMGHKHVALKALRDLKLDEIWCLVSPGNPLKDGHSNMAPFEIRVEKTKAFLQHPRIKVISIEDQLQTRYTADTLEKLCKIMPLTKFTWIMGSDNALIFHKWGRWREIMGRVPIAIFDRTGYSKGGRKSRALTEYRRFQTSPNKLANSTAPSWCFMDGVRHPASATLIRNQTENNWWDH